MQGMWSLGNDAQLLRTPLFLRPTLTLQVYCTVYLKGRQTAAAAELTQVRDNQETNHLLPMAPLLFFLAGE